LGFEDHVGQEQGERLAADDIARAPDGVTEPERLLLAGEAGLARLRQFAAKLFERFMFATDLEGGFEFKLAVEMILDDALVAAGDKDEMLDARLAGLIDGVLDDRLVDDR